MSVAERPILFSTPMIRAILDGRKTQTRRMLKDVPPKPPARCHPRHTQKHPEPYLDSYCSKRPSEQNPRGMSEHWCWWQVDDRQCLPTFKVKCCPGDTLWVRETWKPHAQTSVHTAAIYRADYSNEVLANALGKWRPSIHMPRSASRINLLVTDVRVQRLQEISEEDAKAEGLQFRMDWLPQYRGSDDLPWCSEFPRDAFRDLWQSINGAQSWDANPWVYALTFERKS